MKTIRRKLFLTYAGLLFLTVLLLGMGLTWFLRGFYVETIQRRVTEEARLVGELLKPVLNDYPENFERAQTDSYIEYLGQQTSARITVIAPDGLVLGDSAEMAQQMDNHLTRVEIRKAQQNGVGSSIRYSQTIGEEMLYTAVSLTDERHIIGYLRLALPLAQLNMALVRLRYGLLATSLLVLLFTLGLSFPLSTSLTRPLQEIAAVAKKVSQGELESRIRVGNEDEIGTLADAVNRMAESLQGQLQVVREGKHQLEAILATMVEGIIVFSDDGRALIVNPAAAQMLGLEEDGWHGKYDLELIRNKALHDKMRAVSLDRIYQSHELHITFPEKRVLIVNLAPIRAKQMEHADVLAVFHDITRLRKLEDIRSDFVANVSHELRTPLTAIRGFAETLVHDDFNDAETTHRFAKIIYREAQRLHTLIEDILTLAQIESGKTKIADIPINLENVIQDVVDRLDQRLQEYQLKLDLAPQLPQPRGDDRLLTQALYNLLDNALKYTQPGGTITIGVHPQDEMIRLQVADSGIGIPLVAQERIFERFYRVDRARSRRLGGTGLGLAIVKHIVEAHNGRLDLESEEGVGTTISIFLPLNPKQVD
ncbi:MAG: ATP-binding protein [Firmicutes bacterium]|nr:ATP-binding protein [Bacillota bacterium]